MYEVVVVDRFRANHQLRLPDGALEPEHEHQWNVRAFYAGEQLDAMGVLVDFTRVRPRLRAALAEFEGRRLNDLPDFADCNPSAEHVARIIADRLAQDDADGALLRGVEVEEEPGCFARYWRE